MPKSAPDVPPALRLWAWFGAPVPARPGHTQAVGDCPFCGKDGKLYVSQERGTWDCKSCMLEGGPDLGEKGLLARLYDLCGEPGAEACNKLAASRRLLSGDTVRAWGWRVNPLTGEWTVPGYDRHGKIANLYRWVRRPGPKAGPGGYKYRAMGAPGLENALFAPFAATTPVGRPAPDKPDAWVLEGLGDAMAFWEAVSLTKQTGADPPEYVRTGNPELSPLRQTSVYGVPGANGFSDRWTYLFAGKRVTFGLQNDHPKQDEAGRETGLQSYRGAQAAVAVLAGAPEKPGEVHYLRWGPDGHDPSLPSGYDVRDALSAGDGLAGTRVRNLAALLGKVAPIPPGWVTAGGKGVEPGKVQAGPVPCDNWQDLVNAWKRAIKWGPGYETALAVGLACCASVEVGEDQLWVRLMGPPSCLSAETPIHDPVDGTTKTVKERFEAGLPFHVYSMDADGKIVVKKAEPPDQYPAAEMYRVVTKSGRGFRVTAGHRFLTEKGFVSLGEIVASGSFAAYRLPSTSGSGPSTRTDFDEIVKVEPDGEEAYYDFHVPGTENYLADGIVHHNSGKNTLAEGLLTAAEFVESKSNFTGFLSGWKEGRADGQDFSLIARLRNKTMVTLDGDTLLQQPNLLQILAQARDLYERKTTADYGNGISRKYEGVNMTWVLCGTASLRRLDTSELGERFLTVSIMDSIDDEAERDINRRKFNAIRALYASAPVANGKGPDSPEKSLAKRTTGGYVAHLRRTVGSKIAVLDVPDDVGDRLDRCATFVAYLRARESTTQQEEVCREMSTRLLTQFTKLAYCLAVVYNRPAVDAYVMTRVRKVAMDSAKGVSFELCRFLYNDDGSREAAGRGEDDPGVDPARLKVLARFTTDKAQAWIRFLARVGVIETYSKPGARRSTVRLTPKVRDLWREVVGDE